MQKFSAVRNKCAIEKCIVCRISLVFTLTTLLRFFVSRTLVQAPHGAADERIVRSCEGYHGEADGTLLWAATQLFHFTIFALYKIRWIRILTLATRNFSHFQVGALFWMHFHIFHLAA